MVGLSFKSLLICKFPSTSFHFLGVFVGETGRLSCEVSRRLDFDDYTSTVLFAVPVVDWSLRLEVPPDAGLVFLASTRQRWSAAFP